MPTGRVCWLYGWRGLNVCNLGHIGTPNNNKAYQVGMVYTGHFGDCVLLGVLHYIITLLYTLVILPQLWEVDENCPLKVVIYLLESDFPQQTG